MLTKEQALDLSRYHQLVSNFFKQPATPEEWERYRLTDDQVSFFHENGYLSNIKLLEEWQVDALNEELLAIASPEHPENDLFYEFHSNVTYRCQHA